MFPLFVGDGLQESFSISYEVLAGKSIATSKRAGFARKGGDRVVAKRPREVRGRREIIGIDVIDMIARPRPKGGLYAVDPGGSRARPARANASDARENEGRRRSYERPAASLKVSSNGFV
jgi:hypothetical protein